LYKPKSIAIAASSGMTIFPLDDADIAMYQAKLSGRNRYHLFDLTEEQKKCNCRRYYCAIKSF